MFDEIKLTMQNGRNISVKRTEDEKAGDSYTFARPGEEDVTIPDWVFNAVLQIGRCL